ncbi:pyridoxal 5'-phosphate synthase glutaminase subunit PdxT [uncultured Murdochiella sp.]|uniref:pyridoxal 5'-phosphate synthase glutaminase subunit PdxT n=1 Tax=uncultured Murdochiella sp. TaxID=1586095 RepID=UPI0028047B63|nr:pyridoxal 5'-phosphate synthase glutaminase subunit PdxT [uncultured Murdochiella sp.]
MPTGVLALQGAFIEHEKMLHRLGADVREVRQRADLEGLDGIVLPGGESTVQGRLLRKLNMLHPLRNQIQCGLPVLATCAGLILLAQHLESGEPTHLATLPVMVRRNAYGRQLASFATTADVGSLADFPLVFIRAPYITTVEAGDLGHPEVDPNNLGHLKVDSNDLGRPDTASIPTHRIFSNSDQSESHDADSKTLDLRSDAAAAVEVAHDKNGAPTVEVLCTVSNRIVAVRYASQIGLAFHPELTDDPRLHELFLEMIYH